MVRTLLILALTFGLGCAKEGDKGPEGGSSDDDAACDPTEPLSVTLGTGAASEFYPIQDGDPATLDVAPQGGFGVSIRAITTGLRTDDVVDVNLITEIDGANTGEFLSEGMKLYCQESGEGMVWGAVVGFDPQTFPSNDSLLAIDGESVDLVVEVTDADGDTATGRVTVTIQAGG